MALKVVGYSIKGQAPAGQIVFHASGYQWTASGKTISEYFIW